MEAETASPPPDEMVVTLRKPVSLGSETYTEVRLREPTAGELLQWDKLAGTEADIVAISIVSGIPRPAVEKIGARDLIACARYIAAFLADAP